VNRPTQHVPVPYDPGTHNRRSIRLRGHDYSQPGKYYVTVCTEAKQPLFGYIAEGQMHRNELGDYVALCWEWLAQQCIRTNPLRWNTDPENT